MKNWSQKQTQLFKKCAYNLAGLATEYLGLGFDLSWVQRSDEEVRSAPFECDSTAMFTFSKSF